MASNEFDFDEMRKRTYRSFYADGLVETAVGSLFILVGLVLVGWHYFRSASWLSLTVVAATVLLVLAAPFLVKYAVRSVKARVTYPRTGYVAYRRGEPGAGRWLLVAAAALLAALLLVIPDWLNQMSVAVGVLLALIIGLMGARVGLSRFYLVAAAAAVIGIGAAAFQLDESIGAAVTFAASGLLMLVNGAITLLAYLRRHPRPEDEASYG